MFWPAKQKTDPHGPGFGLAHTNQSAGDRENMWVDVGVVVEVMVHCVGEIAGEHGF